MLAKDYYLWLKMLVIAPNCYSSLGFKWASSLVCPFHLDTIKPTYGAPGGSVG